MNALMLPADEGTMTDHQHPDGFEKFVFPAELEEIRLRRSRLGVEGTLAEGAPSAHLGLVGLAFSGGGIRSASFCLGVLQHLAHTGILRYADYLSTVSGGGYLGASVSSLLGAPESGAGKGPASDPFPLRKEPGEVEPIALRYLRNGSNYLSPPGPLNGLRVPAILLRGLVLSLIAVLPWVIGAVLLTRTAYARLFPVFEERGVDLQFVRTPSPFAAGVLLFCVLCASYPLVVALPRPRFDWHRRNAYEIVTTLALLLALLLLGLWPLAGLVHFAVVSTPRQAEANLLREVARLDGRFGLALAAAVVATGVGAARSRYIERVVRVVGGVMVAVLGAMLPLAMYLGLCLFEIPPQRWVPDHRTVAAALDKGVVPPGVLVTLVALSPEPATRDPPSPDAPDDAPPQLVPTKVVTEVPGTRWQVWATAGHTQVVYGVRSVDSGVMVRPAGRGSAMLLLGAVTLLVLNLFFLDVNITSPHGFFRDRLSKVFVVGLEGGQVVPRDKLKLSELNAETNLSAVAPYHLINATLNLAGSTDVDLRGRDADFFLFSKRFVGSERTGYCPTLKMEDADPHLDLATAMAISAAAASPQMGAMSELREFAPLLALANVRLSYWLPNPVHARKLSRVGAWAVRPGVKYLIKEALGKTDERARFVNVSDGGHIENLGVYQLLRRHCRLIIAVDGEEDRDHQFGALVTLMRYAWIDMGIQIDVDLDPLRLAEHGMTTRHWAVGTIHYRSGETGTLVYLKASVSGNEGEVIRDYRRRQPDFPHESTADQFFTEAQFEAYRALGAHIAEDCWHAMVSDPTRIGYPSPREPSAPS